MQLDFHVLVDDGSGDALPDAFHAYWPAYRKWMQRAPSVKPAVWREKMQEFIPELAGIHESLVNRFSDRNHPEIHPEAVARFLSMYSPPRVVRACTQLVVDIGGKPRLIRTYDHHPKFFDGIVLESHWGQSVALGLSDCIWGMLDGINEHGLAIALAFGGRDVVGDGFGAPLICRHVLQTCATMADARRALDRVPCYMAYTFVVVDASGEFVTAFLAPDRDTTFVTRRASANHQGRIEWEAYAQFAETGERLERAESLIEPDANRDTILQAFLSPPLWRTNYPKASGTLYIAEYVPHKRSMMLHWPGHTESFTIGGVTERAITAQLPAVSGI